MHHCYAPSHSPGREKTKRKVRGHRGDPAEARGSLSLFSSTLLSGFSARRCAGDTVGSETEAVPPLTCHPPDRLSNASNHGLRRLTALRLRHRVSDRRSRAAYSDDGEDQRPQADSGNGGGSAVRRRSAPRCGRGSKRGGVEQVDLSVRVRVTKGEGGFALHVSGGAPRGAERLAGLILRHTHLPDVSRHQDNPRHARVRRRRVSVRPPLAAAGVRAAAARAGTMAAVGRASAAVRSRWVHGRTLAVLSSIAFCKNSSMAVKLTDLYAWMKLVAMNLICLFVR